MKYFFCFLSFILISSISSHSNSGCPSHITNCSLCGQAKCLKCAKSFYNYLGSCFDICPVGLFADNYSMTCKKKKDDSVYIKAYSTSQCLNQCGNKYTDCSCDLMCRRRGDCCSDFKICDIIEENFNASILDENETYEQSITIPGCKFDSYDHKICLQCKDDFYLYNNNCIKACPENAFQDEINKICEDAPEKCPRGIFLHGAKCVNICPVGSRANRINFTCQKKDIYSFYWIFPSKGSCRGNCGRNVEQLNSDCSCQALCLRQGNCCDDFDTQCPYEISLSVCRNCNSCIDGKCEACKENSRPDGKGKCKCNKGYEYDGELDMCMGKGELDIKEILGSTRNKTLEKSKEGQSKIHKTNRRSRISQGILNFPAVFSGFLPTADGKSNHMVGFNGNSTINVYKGNLNLKVITKNEKNINSYNNKKNEMENINSKNLARGDMPGISDIMKELGQDLQVMKMMNKGKHIDSNNNNNPSTNSTSSGTVDYSALLSHGKKNKTEKNIYVHNDIFVNDNSVKLLHPETPNVFAVNKTQEEEEDNEMLTQIIGKKMKTKKKKPKGVDALEDDAEVEARGSPKKNQKINTVIVFNSNDSNFKPLGRKLTKFYNNPHLRPHDEENLTE